jgi:hypothetical protein
VRAGSGSTVVKVEFTLARLDFPRLESMSCYGRLDIGLPRVPRQRIQQDAAIFQIWAPDGQQMRGPTMPHICSRLTRDSARRGER